jgi:hypothetical protein
MPTQICTIVFALLVIILDYDDTLLCTSYLAYDLEYIAQLEQSVVDFLHICIRLGEVYLISNAGLNWIRHSSSVVFPKAHDILIKQCHIISACFGRNDANTKLRCFLKLVSKHPVSMATHIYCIGDSLAEMEAAHKLSRYNCNKLLFMLRSKQL